MRRWLAAGVAMALTAPACLVEIKPLGEGAGGQGGTPAGAGSGAGTNTGGTGGTGGGTGGSGAPCPPGMIHATGGTVDASFCIDRTEVTQAQYLQFLVGVGNQVPPQPAGCEGNSGLTHTPDGTCPDFNTSSEMPIWCVDWCDAWSYCDWAGKRLCRALDGSALDLDDDPVLGEWHYACSGGLMTSHPYGNDPDPAACHIDNELPKDPVMSYPNCEGGFPDLWDMQGNVHEWVDACSSDQADADCRIRGGSTYGAASQWHCARVEAQMALTRLENDDRGVGIRCCKDAD